MFSLTVADVDPVWRRSVFGPGASVWTPADKQNQNQISSYSDTGLSKGTRGSDVVTVEPVQDQTVMSSPAAGVQVTRSLVQHVSCRQSVGGGLWIRWVSETSVFFSASRRFFYTGPRPRLGVVTRRFHGDPIRPHQ